MIRLFAGSTRDRVVPGNALTLGSLLLHLLGAGALLVPLGHVVRSAILDSAMVYLAPPDQEPVETPQPGLQTSADPASAPGVPVPGRAAIEPTEPNPGQGAAVQPGAAEPMDQPAPRMIEAAAATELEVDSAVVRDPASAAPAYPPLLLSKGIAGYAFVRFVVDTLGVVDTISFRVVEATHPEFALAVRTALPGMRFRAAIQQGHRVPQWVEQKFHFRIMRTDTTAVMR
jgi:TonB family protein